MSTVAVLWPLQWWLTTQQEATPVSPWRIRLFFYWVCVFVAKGVAGTPFLPNAVKSWIIPSVVRASSFFLGHQSQPDIYLGCSVLAKAIEDDDADKVLEIIQTYPTSASTPWMGIAPLNYAVQTSRFRAAEALIDYGKQDPMLALKSCRTVPALKFLVSKGANPQFPDSEGCRSVDVAAVNGWIEVAEAMIRLDAYPSPAIIATLRKRGHTEIAKRLASFVKSLRSEKRRIASLVLIRSCERAYHNELVCERIFQLAGVDDNERSVL